MSTLLVDAGNTRIKWRPLARPDGFDDQPTAAVDGWAARLVGLASIPMRRALVSCVAGSDVALALERALRATWPGIDCVEVVAQADACGVVNDYADPSRLGADRWAGLVGAHAAWPDRTVIVCGCGTATTLDLLVPDADGKARFVGGSILPGFEAMRRSLATTTAQLAVNPGRVVDFAIRTEDAIASGILMAQVGAVRMAHGAAVHRLRHAAPEGRIVCLLAGGDAERIAPYLTDGEFEVGVVTDLVLRGLAICAKSAEKGDVAPAPPRHPATAP